MSKFCDKCGAELRNENFKFCDKCGAEVLSNKNKSNHRTANRRAITICPYCGQETPMGQVICVKCGSSLEDNTIGIIVCYIVSLLFGGLLGSLIYPDFYLFSFLFHFISLISGIYLLTKNQKSKIYGIHICIFSILIFFAGFIFERFIILCLCIIFVISIILVVIINNYIKSNSV